MSRCGISSGGVVFQGKDVLIVQYCEGGWTFPKGHVELEEDVPLAAVREVFEETGVHAEVLEFLDETYYTNRRGEARNVHWYLMRAIQGSEVHLEPTFREGGFYSIEQASQLLDFDQDRKLLEKASSLWRRP